MNSSILISLAILLLLLIGGATAATFTILNNCLYTVWAAANPGGGRQLNNGQTWTLDVAPGSTGRIWARTGCSFDGAGRGQCQTGDCGGVLECRGYGQPPNTLVEYALNQTKLDFYDISMVDGFNVPLQFIPTSDCRPLMCAIDVNGKCPQTLRAPGGCNNPCTVFKSEEYCCTSRPQSCGATNYSRFFKQWCPDAYTYPTEEQYNMFTCSAGSNYGVVFCPGEETQDGAYNNCIGGFTVEM